MSDREALTLDLSDPAVRRRLKEHIDGLRGPHEVSIRPRKRTRSLDQNRYYWAAVVTPWLGWLKEAEGDPSIDKEQAHVALKGAVLGARRRGNGTGAYVVIPPSSRTMKTDEFANYVEAAAKFLAEFAGIIVEPAETFYEKKR